MSEGAGRAPELATFWHGPLNAIVYNCLASFPSAGVALRLYSYDPDVDAPPGVVVADARSICPDESLLGRYLAHGKPSLAKFADMFRYKMIRDTGCCWVDADIVCLRPPDFSADPIVFGRQSNPYGEVLINNAVLKLPFDHPTLAELIDRAEQAVDVDQPWGAIGPFLLTALAIRDGIEPQARDFRAFYPIEPDDYWKLLAPAAEADVIAAVEDSTFLHLWSEMFDRSDYDMSVCPPAGSFLYKAFQRVGALHRFSRVYEERELGAPIGQRIREDTAGQV